MNGTGDDAMDDRAERVLGRARDILAREPTEAERQEHEARGKANRLARIMAGPVRKDATPMRYRVQENALLPPRKTYAQTRAADAAERREIERRADAGERLSREDRARWWTLRGTDLLDDADEHFRKGRPVDAMGLLFIEFAGACIAQTQNRLKLEDRVAVLERAVKPRVRVKAGSRVLP